MAERVLSNDEQDELTLRIGFLKEIFHVLCEAKNLKIGTLETLLLGAENTLDEIKDILDGKKKIMPRNGNTLLGWN